MDREKFELQVGAFVLLGMVMLGVIITILGSKQDMFSRQYMLVAEFDDVDGLKAGAPIRLSGVDVGQVGEITFPEKPGDKKLRVALEIRSEVQKRIRADSRAAITTQGVLGDKYVAITLGTGGAPLAENSLIASEPPLDYGAIVATAGKTIDHLNAITAKVDEMLATGTDDSTKKSAASIIGSIGSLLHEVETGNGLAHRLIYDRQAAGLLDSVAHASQNVSALTDQAENGNGFVAALLNDPKQRDAFENLTASASDLHESVTELKTILGRVDRGEGTLGALINDSGAYDDLRALLGRANRNIILRTVIRHTIDKNEKLPAGESTGPEVEPPAEKPRTISGANPAR